MRPPHNLSDMEVLIVINLPRHGILEDPSNSDVPQVLKVWLKVVEGLVHFIPYMKPHYVLPKMLYALLLLTHAITLNTPGKQLCVLDQLVHQWVYLVERQRAAVSVVNAETTTLYATMDSWRKWTNNTQICQLHGWPVQWFCQHCIKLHKDPKDTIGGLWSSSPLL